MQLADQSYVPIQVADTGCSISQGNQLRIFTPFFTTKAIGKGTGFGLSITYGIIKMKSG
jgi:signal transduction histidine kinase